MYSRAAAIQCPWDTSARPAVAAQPSSVIISSSRTRELERSAIAPSTGASSAITAAPRPFSTPSRNVLSVATTPAFQYSLKNTGKNPAMTVVANAEFAQS